MTNDPTQVTLGWVLALALVLGSSAIQDESNTSILLDTVLPMSPESLEMTDVLTGSSELSGIALNEATSQIVMVDDENWLYTIDADKVGVDEPRRARFLVAGDLEGIAWLWDDVYAVASENTGTIFVIRIREATEVIDGSDVLHRFRTGIVETSGAGLEGVAVDPSTLEAGRRDLSQLEFFVVSERPPTLRKVGPNVEISSPIGIPQVLDASDLWADGPTRLFVLSDESRTVIELAVDANLASLELKASQSLVIGESWFEQPEGLAFSRDLSEMFVVGENPGHQRIAFGRFRFAPH